MSLNRFNKIKEVLREILEKSVRKETTSEILHKDAKVIGSYITFSIEKRVEKVMTGLNAKSEIETKAEREIDHADLCDLRASIKVMVADWNYDLLYVLKDIESLLKAEIIQNLAESLDVLLIKSMNRLCPMKLVVVDEEIQIEEENEKIYG